MRKFCPVRTHVIYDYLVFPDAAVSAKCTQHSCNDFILVMGLSRHGRSLTALGSLLCLLSTMTTNILPATIWKRRVQNITALWGGELLEHVQDLCAFRTLMVFLRY